METVQYKNLKFQVWDLGGQTSIRPYWRCYYSNTDAIIYVVDSMDRDRIGISKQELVSMLEVPALNLCWVHGHLVTPFGSLLDPLVCITFIKIKETGVSLGRRSR